MQQWPDAEAQTLLLDSCSHHFLRDIRPFTAVRTSQIKLIIFCLNLLFLPPSPPILLTTQNYLFPISFNATPIHCLPSCNS